MKKYIKGFKNYTFLLSELVKKGVRLKYRRSYLGILWSLIEPLLTMIVLVIVFGTLFHRDEATFPLYIITARLLYSFFSTSTKAGSKSVRANAAMIKKVYVPKYLYPLSSVIFNYTIFLISLVVMIPVMIYTKTFPHLAYVWQMIPALVLIFILSLGVSMFLATLNVFFRDIEYLWNVILMIIMYLSAIFYPVERIMGSKWYFLLKLNPVYGCIHMMRGAFMGYLAEPWYLLYATGFSCVFLVVGVLFFKWKQDEFILNL